MENPTETKEDERSCDVTKPVEAVETVTKVENKEEVKTERPTPTTKSSGRKRSQERERDRSRDRQTVRERHRRGERSRGGERAAPKGSIYRPRSRPECRVHISNIPYEYRWQDLKDLFRNEVGEVSFVELFEDEHGKPRGCGVVEFEKLEHARIALDKMNRFELKGRHLVVKEDIDIERDGYGRLIGAGNSISGRQESRDEMPPPHSSGREYGDNLGHGGMRYGPGNNIGTLASPSSTRWSNTYGLSPQFLDSLGISGPLFHRIFVANLDYKVDDAKLREVFRLAGKVVVAEVVKDRDGRSRGFGVVEMSHPIEAVQAISMFNNQMLFDRRMTVRMDRDAERIETTRSSRLPEGLRSIGMGLGTGGNPLQDVPRGGIMPLPSDRHPDSYRNSSDLNFRNRARGDVDLASVDVGMSSMDNNFSSMSGGPVGMGGQIERSVPGLHTMGNNPSMHSLSMSDYRRNTLETDYNVQSGVGNNGLLNGGAGSSNSTSYGYLTENLSARGSTLSSVPDYERRDAYAGYRTNQPTRERQEYLSVSTGYDTGNRMSTVGSIQSSISTGTSVDASRLSDTIVVTNLPPNCTWQDLRDKFCEVGDVLFADIRAKGTGVVRFSSERDAQRACSMLNRTRMESHTIEVEFY